MKRPRNRRYTTRTSRRSRKGFLSDLSGSQLAFAILGMVMIVSLVIGTLAVPVINALNDPAETDEDPGEFSQEEQAFETQLRERLRQNPDDVNALTQLGDFLANTGNLTEAISLYERATTLRPNDPVIRFNFARALQDGNKTADAEYQFLQVLALNPADAQAHYYLAKLYLDWEPPRVEEAIEHYNQVITLGPDSVLAGLAATELRNMGEGTPVLPTASPSPAPGGG